MNERNQTDVNLQWHRKKKIATYGDKFLYKVCIKLSYQPYQQQKKLHHYKTYFAFK